MYTSKCNDLHNSLYGNDPDDPEMPDLIPVQKSSDGEKTRPDRQVLVKAAIEHGIAASAEDVDMIIRTMSEDRMAMNIAASAKVDSDRVGMHTNPVTCEKKVTWTGLPPDELYQNMTSLRSVPRSVNDKLFEEITNGMDWTNYGVGYATHRAKMNLGIAVRMHPQAVDRIGPKPVAPEPGGGYTRVEQPGGEVDAASCARRRTGNIIILSGSVVFDRFGFLP